MNLRHKFARSVALSKQTFRKSLIRYRTTFRLLFRRLYNDGNWPFGFLPLDHAVRHTHTEIGTSSSPPVLLSFRHLCASSTYMLPRRQTINSVTRCPVTWKAKSTTKNGQIAKRKTKIFLTSLRYAYPPKICVFNCLLHESYCDNQKMNVRGLDRLESRCNPEVMKVS